MWLSVTETESLAYGQSLTLACPSPEREVEVDGKAVQSRCCASGRVCSSVPHYQRGRQRSCVLQCHYSSTQAPGSRSLLTWHSDIVVETALGAKGWLRTLLTAKRQTHPGRPAGYWCPWVLMRIQQFSSYNVKKLLYLPNSIVHQCRTVEFDVMLPQWASRLILSD